MSTQALHENFSNEEFLADLCEQVELAKILGVQPQTIPVMRARGKLKDIAEYRRGRKVLSSRSDAVAVVRASRIS